MELSESRVFKKVVRLSLLRAQQTRSMSLTSGLVDTGGLKTQERGLEEGLWGTESRKQREIFSI